MTHVPIAQRRRTVILGTYGVCAELNPKQLLLRLNQGHLQNVDFSDLVALVEALGFRLKRTSGSHHIFGQDAVSEMLNLQPLHGQAKPYQVRQLLRLIEEYNLKLSE